MTKREENGRGRGRQETKSAPIEWTGSSREKKRGTGWPAHTFGEEEKNGTDKGQSLRMEMSGGALAFSSSSTEHSKKKKKEKRTWCPGGTKTKRAVPLGSQKKAGWERQIQAGQQGKKIIGRSTPGRGGAWEGGKRSPSRVMKGEEDQFA